MEKIKLTTISTVDSVSLSADLYLPRGPQGLIVIFHGMMEHRARYQELIDFLTDKQYAILACGMRGHGESTLPLGYFGKTQGWWLNLLDLRALVIQARQRLPELPNYLIAHSMGTLFARAYLKYFPDEFKKVVLSGTPAADPLLPLALILAHIQKIKPGDLAPNPLLHKLVIENYNKAIKNPRTPYDWLSYDQANVDSYLADPLAGFVFTTGGFLDLFKVTKQAYSKTGWKKPHQPAEIFFISGDDDPCASPRAFALAIAQIKARGYKHTFGRRYLEMRHEILHEAGRETVFQDIADFIAAKPIK